MITLQNYKKSKIIVEKIHKEINNNEKMIDKQIKRLECDVKKKIDKIHEKKEKEIKIIDKMRKDFREKKEVEILPFNNYIISYRRILDIFRVYLTTKVSNLNEIEIYRWDYPKDEKGGIIKTKNGDYPEKIKIHYEPVGIISQDHFKDIKIYIVDNDNYRKKINKFGLWIIGKCIFPTSLIKLPFSYNGDFFTEGENIKSLLKEAPTKEELLIWFKKNKVKIFKEKLEEINNLQEEYKETIKLWDNKKWRIAYYEKEKENYEKNYSNGIETEEYKEIIKILEKEKQQFKKIK